MLGLYLQCGMLFEVMYLYVDTGLRNWNDYYTKGLSFFLSWVSKTQPEYRTKLMIDIACLFD